MALTCVARWYAQTGNAEPAVKQGVVGVVAQRPIIATTSGNTVSAGQGWCGVISGSRAEKRRTTRVSAGQRGVVRVVGRKLPYGEATPSGWFASPGPAQAPPREWRRTSTLSKSRGDVVKRTVGYWIREVGYWVRPFDMLAASERRWFWQRPTGCGFFPRERRWWRR